MSIAKTDRFLIDGYNVAAYLKSFAPSSTVDELDATVLASTYRVYEPGFKQASLSARGVFDNDATDTDRIHDVLSAAYGAGTAKVITAGMQFYSDGGDALMMDACAVKYAIPLTVGDLIFADPEFRSTNGLSFGKWLISSQLNAGTTNGTVVDNGAATSNGGILHVHLVNDDATDVDVKVQHSTTGVGSWVDLVAVNNLSAEHDAGMAVVAKGTAVNRYLRAVATVTGGDTVLLSAAFARRY